MSPAGLLDGVVTVPNHCPGWSETLRESPLVRRLTEPGDVIRETTPKPRGSVPVPEARPQQQTATSEYQLRGRPTPRRYRSKMPTVLYLVESGSMYAGPEGEARALTADPGYRDPTCEVDVDGTKGHRCVNRNNDPLPRGHACWVNARKQILSIDAYWASDGPEAA